MFCAALCRIIYHYVSSMRCPYSCPLCTCHHQLLVGLLYAAFYLCSAAGTRHSHALACLFSSDKMAMDVLFNLELCLVLAVGLAVASPTV